MVQNAVGLIETVGLTAAIEAADAAVKAANIKLIGYELTKGGGMVVVKLSGDVGAIQAAVEAGRLAAGQVGRVWATHIMPRPHQETAGLVYTRETIRANDDTGIAAKEQQETGKASEPGAGPAVQAQAAVPTAAPVKKGGEICNLCGDPACPRKKGDPKATCLHYNKIKEDE
ncbi:BMC domain-containing protein [Acetonema longum]|uniref:Microcompartments protein n=1 Tax=Acetonema longum DSM 6540 TaxID=1009370 RepID=F7NH19_9FIRM|nr:BMC domain-containing protein [Acetonema longum]EGO64750.1 microcompartments protein [Acetonema longum DSM 6540]